MWIVVSLLVRGSFFCSCYYQLHRRRLDSPRWRYRSRVLHYDAAFHDIYDGDSDDDPQIHLEMNEICVDKVHSADKTHGDAAARARSSWPNDRHCHRHCRRHCTMPTKVMEISTAKEGELPPSIPSWWMADWIVMVRRSEVNEQWMPIGPDFNATNGSDYKQTDRIISKRTGL
jgi:hypothetical protein